MSTIQLYKDHPSTHERIAIGAITEAQLDFLVGNLESEFEDDEECFMNSETVDYLREQGADPALLAILEKALVGIQDGVDISYENSNLNN